MTIIDNPILTGFNPDPAICRVGEEFYIATSTFEWHPGVHIWQSRTLSHWQPVARPLDRTDLMSLEGIQSSGGIWAPCLTWNRGLFYLVYTVVRTWRGETGRDWGAFKDTLNFLTTAPAITGPWSEPVFLNSSGFDPSLFHDDDGRTWLLNMQWDYRNRGTYFSGILLQEYDTFEHILVGPVRKIFEGTSLGSVEGPHLYKRNGWYYLITAEGGTSYRHAVTLARSQSLSGPFEIFPDNPLITGLTSAGDLEAVEAFAPQTAGSWHAPEGFFDRPQKVGHASMCALTDREWVLVHLSGRPLPGTIACPLGRETCIQRILWGDDAWPRVVDNQGRPVHRALSSVAFPSFHGREKGPAAEQQRGGESRVLKDHFDSPILTDEFMFLRRSPGEDAALDIRPGWLRLVGRESPVSPFRQTIVATKVSSFHYTAETLIDFAPQSFQQMAGLVLRYDERNQYILRIAGDDESGQRTLGIIVFDTGSLFLPLGEREIPLPEGPVALRVYVRERAVRFYWSPGDTEEWQTVGPELDAAKLSDENAWPLGFTGTVVGMACYDLTGKGLFADFDYFLYEAC
jgi:xylan 1,4-beta-xylosidase